MTKPKTFQLRYRKPTRDQGERNGMLSHIAASMASDERIREATPSLQALYAFLKRPLP